MKRLILTVLVITAFINSAAIGVNKSNTVLTRLLADANIQQLLSKYNNVLYVVEATYCKSNDCEKLLADLPTEVEVRVHSREDLFMRRIPDYLEIIELRPDYLKAIIHGLDISFLLEIKA